MAVVLMLTNGVIGTSIIRRTICVLISMNALMVNLKIPANWSGHILFRSKTWFISSFCLYLPAFLPLRGTELMIQNQYHSSRKLTQPHSRVRSFQFILSHSAQLSTPKFGYFHLWTLSQQWLSRDGLACHIASNSVTYMREKCFIQPVQFIATRNHDSYFVLQIITETAVILRDMNYIRTLIPVTEKWQIVRKNSEDQEEERTLFLFNGWSFQLPLGYLVSIHDCGHNGCWRSGISVSITVWTFNFNLVKSSRLSSSQSCAVVRLFENYLFEDNCSVLSFQLRQKLWRWRMKWSSLMALWESSVDWLNKTVE